MSNYNDEEERTPEESLGDMGKKAGKKAGEAGKKVAKEGAKKAIRKGFNMASKAAAKATMAMGKAVMGAIAAIGAKVILIVLAASLVLLFITIAFHVIMEFASSSGDYTEGEEKNTNVLALHLDSKKKVKYQQVEELDGANESVVNFYKNLTQRGYWVADPESKNWSIEDGVIPRLLTPQEALDKNLVDHYKQEDVFGLNGDFLFAINNYVYRNKMIYPEHFLQSVPIKITENYDYAEDDKFKVDRPYVIELDDLVNEDGELIARSRKYNRKKRKFVEERTVKSTHDYGLATVFQYRAGQLEQYAEGTYVLEDYYNEETNRIEQREINQPFKDKIDGFPQDIWLLDVAATYTGNYVFEYEETETPIGELHDEEGPVNSSASKIKIGEVDLYTDPLTIYVRDENGVQTGETVEEVHFIETKPLYKYREGNIIEVKPEITGPPRNRLEVEAKLDEIEDEEERKEKEKEINEEIRKQRNKFAYSYFGNFTALPPEIIYGKFNFEARSNALGLDINFDTGSGLDKAKYANALKYLPLITKHANEFGVDPYVILAIMTQESGGDPNISNPGGIMQLSWNPGGTLEITSTNVNGQKVSHTLGGGEARKDVNDGVRYAVMKYKNMLEKHNNNPIKAIQNYNFGVDGYMKEYHPDAWADDETNSWTAHLEDARKYYAQKETGRSDTVSASYHCAPELAPPNAKDANAFRYGDLCYISNVLQYYDKDAAGTNGSPIPSTLDGDKEEEEEEEVCETNEDGKVTCKPAKKPVCKDGIDENGKACVGIEVNQGLQGKHKSKNAFSAFAKLIGLNSLFNFDEEEFERFTYTNRIHEDKVDEMLLYAQSYIDNTPMSLTKEFEPIFGNNGNEDLAGINGLFDFDNIGDIQNWGAGAGTITAAEIAEFKAMGIERPARTGRISSRFGHRTIGKKSRFHAGADLAIPKGTPLHAVSDGYVRAFNSTCPQEGFHDNAGGGCYVNGKPMGWGNFVQIIFPNGYYTVYGHMSEVAPGLSVGAPVKKGDIIGWSGNSGNTTGPHLHVELRRPNGVYIDPIFLLQAPPGTNNNVATGDGSGMKPSNNSGGKGNGNSGSSGSGSGSGSGSSHGYVEYKPNVKPTYISGVLLVNKKHPFPKNGASGVDPKASAAYNKLSAAAKKEIGVTTEAFSTFRSHDYQKGNFDRQVKANGLEHALKYVAKPGFSEHETGLAMDVGDVKHKNIRLKEEMANTEFGRWLNNNAHRFGFIIRYPKGKEHITGIDYEPWHIRYVGENHAKAIYNSGMTLEEYLNAK